MSNLGQLNTLTVGGCLAFQDLGNGVSRLSCLQELIMYNLPSLRELPDGMSGMVALQCLEMQQLSLETWPNSISCLTNLTKLEVIACNQFESVGKEFEHLLRLEELVLYSCTGVKRLDFEMQALQGLISLVLSGCTCLEMITDSIDKLSNLQEPFLANCSSLRSLPLSVSQWPHHGYILLNGCTSLQNADEWKALARNSNDETSEEQVLQH